MKKEMLINVLQPEEIRIAIVEDGVLEELYVERTSHESYVGNIYKGRIVNIEPSIQAAFVDFGVGRNGSHVSDVEPAYYRQMEGFQDERGRRSPRDRHRTERPRDYRSRRARPPQDDELIDQLEELEHERYEMPVTEVFPPSDEGPAPLGGREFAGLPDELGDDMDEVEIKELSDDGPGEYRAHDGPGDAEASGVTGQYVSPAEFGGPTDETELEDPVHPPGADSDDRATELETPASEESREEQETDADKKGPQRGRRRRGKPRRATKDKSAPAEGADERADDGAKGDDGPRLMDSAERRTGADDDPLEPIEPRPTFRDEDLSFSLGGQASPPPPRSARREPAPRREPPTPAEMGFEVVNPDDPVDAPAPADEYDPRTADEFERLLHDQPAHSDEPLTVTNFEPLSEGDADLAQFDDYVPPPREGRDRGDRGGRDRGGRGRDDRGRDDRARDDRARDDRGPDDRGRDDRGRDDRGRGAPRGRGRPMMGGRPGFGRPKPPIQEIFKRGQEVLVQVIKEGIGTKGPTLSTYISIAGRYLVLMPGLQRIGVSRKIDDDDSRRRLRQIMQELQPPRGVGFIIRTAGIDRDKKELQRDLVYLAKLWQVVVRRIKKLKSPAAIYQESDMITRTIRDIFAGDIDDIWVDEKEAYEHAKEFMQIVMPRYAPRLKLHDDKVPMFHKYGIEQEIARIQQRHVPLPNGGSIVIDQTEALVAIDVNSGSFRADNNAEETAYQMNLQAAREIARQLRLRDLGGVIVNDFIDMRGESHRRNVERALRDAVRRDRARTKLLRMSQFGIIEMTRQRIRPSLKRSAFQECPHCKGTGHVKTWESMSIEVMRLLQLAAHREFIQRIEVRVHEEVANYLLNRKRGEIAQLEQGSGKQILITGRTAVAPEFLEFVCYDGNNNEVKFLPFDEPKVIRPRRGERGERGGRDRGDRGERGGRERGERGERGGRERAERSDRGGRERGDRGGAERGGRERGDRGGRERGRGGERGRERPERGRED